MKIICLQENLIKGLQTVSHLAGKNTNLPILNNVLISTENGQITLTTTNLEIGISCKIRGKVEVDGKCTVQAKLLTDFINLLPRDNVVIELEDDKLKIECANDKTSINTLSSEDFPLLPGVDRKNEYIIKTNILRSALLKTVFSVALDSTRPEISGAFLSIKDKKITLVGTDSYRLAEKSINLDESVGDNKIIIPIETVQEMIRIASDTSEENVKLYVDENQILFAADGIELVSRLTEGSYPDYKQIIPTESKTRVEVGVSELTQAIKRTSLFCKPGINDVKLSFVPEKNEIVLMSTSNQLGENITTVQAKIEGIENEITFNYRYLLDGLANLGNSNLILEINDNTSPGLIKSDNDKDYVYIIMPIKQ
jgi:DNA polymerase III subunit beta